MPPLILNGTTGVSGVDGSAGTPSYQGTDTNTGIFYPAADTIAFAEGGTEVMRIDSSGNLALGSTSSLSSSANRIDLTINGANQSILSLGVAGTRRGYLFENGTDLSLGSETASGALLFLTNSAERMRIISGGSVGIGTSSPSSIHCLTLAASGTITQGIRVNLADNNKAALYVPVGFINGDSTGAQGKFTIGNFGDSASEMTVATRGFISFYTGAFDNATGTERMRIDSSGNVGIGVTPSPWSNFKVLQISSIGALAAHDFGSGNTQVRLFSNAYWDGANFRYITSNTAAMYSINGREHIWSSAASGTAGNTISFVDSLRINTNGNLVLQGGTTTANGVGVTFPATQSASSDANTLDDYEEGTFTPNLFDGTNNVSMGTCTYTKIGNLVTIHVNGYGLNVTSLGAGSALQITGLPFAKQTLFNFFQLLLNQTGTNTVTCGDGSSTTTNLYTPNTSQDYDFFTRNKWGGATSITLRFTMTYRTT